MASPSGAITTTSRFGAKQQPVKPSEDVVVTVDDIHESGAGVGRTEDGFIVLVDGLLPAVPSFVVDQVNSNHARAEEVERLEMDEDPSESETEENDAELTRRTTMPIMTAYVSEVGTTSGAARTHRSDSSRAALL